MRLDGELDHSSAEFNVSTVSKSKNLVMLRSSQGRSCFFGFWPQAGVGAALWTVCVGLSFVVLYRSVAVLVVRTEALHHGCCDVCPRRGDLILAGNGRQ